MIDPGVFRVHLQGVWERRRPAALAALTVTIPRQSAQPVDFHWLGINPNLESQADFVVVRRVGHFELYHSDTGERVYGFDPPLLIEVPYDAQDWRLAQDTPHGQLSLAFWDDRAPRPRWVRFGEQGDDSTFEVVGDQRGGVLRVVLRRWSACEMACGG
jgi:hypothetical protein